ncbi:Pediocin PA-1 biosynthesis protein pedC [Lactobacillus sp. ESL0230]|uniref:Pediocin PA-1 biosynthesis protein pedC n=1 Tax=Lactobacillus sp. ESL0230 TaxID=2069353 RepID=UPI000EFBF906|nr:Pediocin PA-1 biosynthesis protein pedC [Lactobacillus sp. ESL0230]RMC46734.1 Pediocin PA-1 biosynthesis protein pedC [Lactobacillus sp. ESL0230]
MKKAKKASLIVIILFFISIFRSFDSELVKAANTNTIEYSQQEDEIPSIQEYEYNIQKTVPITPIELISKTQAGQTLIVFIGFKECPACRAFSPTLKSFLDNSNRKLYYFNLDIISKDDLTPELNNIIKNIIKLKGTPTIALLKHGKLIHEYLGSNVTEEQLHTLTKYKLN